MTKFMVFDRWGSMIAEAVGIESAKRSATINGSDTLSVEMPYVLSKGDRILWEHHGIWREHVVNELTQTHDGAETCSYVCDHALQWDLRLAHVRYTHWTAATATYALTELLKLTSWSVGKVQASGTAEFEWEHKNAYECLLEIAGAFGLEIEAAVEVDERGVSTRRVNMVPARGNYTDIRFDYGFGLEGVTKEILADDVITACYGYGASDGSDPNSSLTFASINGGVPYVADEEAKLLWGLPDGKGGLMHAFGFYENSECEDARQLLQETRDYLAQHSSPAINYRMDVPYAVVQGVDLGDVIQVVDTDFTPPMRLETRVGSIDEDVLDDVTESVEFGTIVSVVPDVYARAYRQSSTALSVANAALGSVNSTSSDLSSVNRKIDSMATSFTTETLKSSAITATAISIVNSDDDQYAGTLSVKEDGLYFNEVRIGGFEDG